MLIHGKTEQNMQKCRIFSVDIEEVLICDKILFTHDSKNLQNKLQIVKPKVHV